MAHGIRLTHKTFRSCVVAFETPRRYEVPFTCPSCHVVHVRKTVHLWFDDVGSVTVSEGVLRDLLMAGLENLGLEQVGYVPIPPVLVVSKRASREEQDYRNRSIREWSVA